MADVPDTVGSQKVPTTGKHTEVNAGAGVQDVETGAHQKGAAQDVVTAAHQKGTVHVVVQRCTRAKLLVSATKLEVRSARHVGACVGWD